MCEEFQFQQNDYNDDTHTRQLLGITATTNTSTILPQTFSSSQPTRCTGGEGYRIQAQRRFHIYTDTYTVLRIYSTFIEGKSNTCTHTHTQRSI